MSAFYCMGALRLDCIHIAGGCIRTLGVAQRRPKGTMTLPMWMAAYDNYALSAAAVGQWSLAASRAHKMLCLELAAKARTDNKPQGLPHIHISLLVQMFVRHYSYCLLSIAGIIVIYDELYRRRLADRAYAGGSTSDPNRVVVELGAGLVDEVEAVWG